MALHAQSFGLQPHGQAHEPGKVFLALVPPGTVSGVLSSVIEVGLGGLPVSPTLEAVQAAIAGAALLAPLVHLAVLLVAFTALARLAPARFGAAA